MVYYTSCQVRALAQKCPECGSGKVVNIIYGYLELSENLKKDLDAGKTRLGGCCVSEDSHVLGVQLLPPRVGGSWRFSQIMDMFHLAHS